MAGRVPPGHKGNAIILRPDGPAFIYHQSVDMENCDPASSNFFDKYECKETADTSRTYVVWVVFKLSDIKIGTVHTYTNISQFQMLQ
jgi:hypothetical protein